MYILVFGDTHGDTDFSHLQEHAKKADLILHCGDLTDFSAQLEGVLDSLNTFAKTIGKHILFVHGNHEGPRVKEHASSREYLVYLHGNTHETDDVIVYGYGGGGFSKNDSVLEKQMMLFQENAPLKAQIWLFHGPPHDTSIDVIDDWGPTGCKSKRLLITQHQPTLVVAGHIHEGWGKVHKEGDTIIVNPGPNGMLIEL